MITFHEIMVHSLPPNICCILCEYQPTDTNSVLTIPVSPLKIQPIASSSLPFPSHSSNSSRSSSVGNLRPFGVSTQGPDLGPLSERPVTLIISFPSRFPAQGLPSFTVRGGGVGLPPTTVILFYFVTFFITCVRS